MTAIALDGLGPAYAAARAAVGREVVSFLARVPGVATLSFANATPFASPETLDWIAGEQARFGAGAGGAASPRASAGGADDDGGAGAVIEAARSGIAGGALDLAIGHALAASNALPTARGRFRARLGVAQLAATRGLPEVALALYEQLLPEATSTLEAWEPALCAALLEGALTTSRAIGAGRHPKGGRDDDEPRGQDEEARASSDRERQTLLLRRLLSLDPAAALRCWG